MAGNDKKKSRPRPDKTRKSTGVRLTRARVEQEIVELKGNLAAIATRLNVTRQTLYNWLHAEPDLKQLLTDTREAATDYVEATLYAKALKGDTTAMIFWLKCMGRDRGWIEQRDYQMAPPSADDNDFRDAVEKIYGADAERRSVRLNEEDDE